MNLSKKKRKEMIDFLEILRKEHKDDKSMRALNEIENALTEKKYGLVWEEHSEQVDEMLLDNIPIFKEIEDKKIVANEEKPFNFLLEGDNLHSLKLLEKTYKGKVDVIYIDPPYNTGNRDFIYDDRIIDKTDGYSHSKWISFMNKRLKIAKKLLTNKGFIFISIDDFEQAPLKLLCDDIFGQDNFVMTLPRQTKKSGKTTGSFSKNHDYVLVYINGSLEMFKMKEHIDKGYKNSDEFVEDRGLYKINQTLDYDSLSYSKSLDYPIEIDGEIFYPGSDKEKYLERHKGHHNRADWAWRWNKDLFDFGYKNGFIVIKRKKDGSARIYTKTYSNAKIKKNSNGEYEIIYEKKTKAMSSIVFTENEYSNDNAKKDLKKLNMDKLFDYSKPINFIKDLIDCHKKDNAIVLDFFAGSGTTGHAVMQLNKEDGGNRKYILCTNNENNICEEITYKRLENIQDDLPHNLKYYRTEFIPKFSIDDDISIKQIMIDNIAPLIELEYGVEIDNIHNIIVIDEEKLKGILQKAKDNINIFITSDIMLSQEEKALAAQKSIKIIEIPEYYFRSELREVGEI